MAARHRDSNDGAATARPPPALRLAMHIAPYLCEIAMLALLVVGGWALGNGGLLSIALAIFYPSLAVLIWSLWIAPTAVHRLADPSRLIAQVLLFAAAATVAGLGGHRLLGTAFAVVASLAFAATRLGTHDSGDTGTHDSGDTGADDCGDTGADSDGDVAQAGSSSSS
ncbi:MAG: hypothetical protein QOH14_2424 [Pseudonocardiales bacterium]|nr:hypothetical protein [Pseudonocardiales bacterium]